MKIQSIQFNNFKPYYDKVFVDLSTEKDKNIVLIGGRNGQGKTSFLVGVVWCLYGGNITTVDKIFRDEVKGNYSKFLSKSLNKKAHREGTTKFSIEVIFSEVELADAFTSGEQKQTTISLKRSFDTADIPAGESFEVLMDGEINELLTNDADKANFVNDYLIPIDLAKFVFFDAEKIAEIAQLGAKDQASIMDEAFGQVLGLNVYENLIEDLEQYKNSLKKESASNDINIQIESFESARKQNKINIEENETKKNELEDRIEELRIESNELTNELIRRGDSSIKVNIEDLKKKEELLNLKVKEVEEKFKEVSDFIPLAIMGHKIEETNEQLKVEKQIEHKQIEHHALKVKTKEFAEKLFNKSPFPEQDIDVDQKHFYYTKTKELLENLYSPQDEHETLEFEHNLDKSEMIHIRDSFELIKSHSKNSFEVIFNQYMRVQNDFQEVTKKIRIAEMSSKDEFIQDLQDRKNELARQQSVGEQEIGKISLLQDTLNRENNDHKIKVKNLLTKVKTSKEVEKKIKVADKYLKSLVLFVANQKQEKRELLEKSLEAELKRLFNKKDLFDHIKLTIHKNKLGIEIKIFDKNGLETSPENWSKGEQQLYVSALLKSILAESIHELPVLIDTPLGRLDQEHRENILKHYYPYLSEQVIIFSTNTEVRVSDLHNISGHLAKTYRLENKEGKTQILEGYFN